MSSLGITIQNAATLNSIKSVDKNYADIGDTINYTIRITNSGDADAINLIVTDLIPQGANFIDNSVKIDGIQKSGVNPALGINVGTILAGITTTILMQALVVTLPFSGNLINAAQLDYQYVDVTTSPSVITRSIDTNSVVTSINTVIPGLIKTALENKLTGVGQILNYMLRISNGGNTTANDLTIIDTIPNGTTFVPNSISIMGSSVAGTVEPPGGFYFGGLPANSYTTLSFQVQVDTIPVNNQISNQGKITYNYSVNPSAGTVNGSSLSNIQTITRDQANLSGITKIVDKTFATTGDILTYTITIPNTGTTTAINVIIVDTIPSGTTYIANTLFINGSGSLDLPNNINIGTISAGGIATVQFKVKVN